VDSTPPKLLNFAIHAPTTVNLTTGTKSIDLHIVVQDDLSGFSYGSIQAIDSVGTLSHQEYFSQGGAAFKYSVAGKPSSFKSKLLFSNYQRPGNYTLRVTLGDTMGNVATADCATVTLINDGFDDTPPTVVDFASSCPHL
jgi:hypothetical protein